MSHPSRSLPHRLLHSPALIMTGLSLLVAANNAPAYGYQWIGGDGDWFDAANWTDAGLSDPISGDGDLMFVILDDDIDRVIQFAGPDSPRYRHVYLNNKGTGRLTLAISDGTFKPQNLAGGWATLEQTGGQVVVEDLAVPDLYNLAGGAVNAENVTVGGFADEPHEIRRRVRIDGGSLHTGWLGLQEGGAVEWINGQVNVDRILELGVWYWSLLQNPLAVMSFPEQPVSVHLDQILQIRQGITIVNGQNVSVELGPDALAIFDPGIEPAELFGSYVNHGLTARIGQPFVVPAGRRVTLNDLRDTPLQVYGHVQGAAGRPAVAELGALHPGATIEDMGLYLRPDSHVVMTDSQLRNVRLYFWLTGADDFASFTQAGGVFEGSIYMDHASGHAAYYMHDGILDGQIIRLTVDSWDDSGHRLFVQTGGFVRMSGHRMVWILDDYLHAALELYAAGADTSTHYQFSGGSLDVASLFVSAQEGGTSRFSITSPHAAFTVREAVAIDGANAHLDIASGTTIEHTGFAMALGRYVEAAHVSDLSHLHLFWSPQPQYQHSFNSPWNHQLLELPSRDRGPTLDGFVNNFALDTLELQDTAGTQGWHLASTLSKSESLHAAFYIEHLILHDGVALYLDDVNLYVQRLTDHGGVIHLSGDGQLILLDMLAGDMDGGVGTQDISLFVLALTDAAAYKAAIAHIDPVAAGDFNADGRLNTEDINPFIAALTSAAHPADGQTAAIPQPTSLALAGVLALAWTTRRRR